MDSEHNELFQDDGASTDIESRLQTKCTGWMAIGSSLTHTWVNSSPTINFPNNIPPVPVPPPPTQVQFQGESTSLAIGGGFLWMSGFLEDPATLLLNGGNVEFQLVTTPIYTRISFFRNGAPLGKLTGLGLNVQVGLTINGTGKFFA